MINANVFLVWTGSSDLNYMLKDNHYLFSRNNVFCFFLLLCYLCISKASEKNLQKSFTLGAIFSHCLWATETETFTMTYDNNHYNGALSSQCRGLSADLIKIICNQKQYEVIGLNGENHLLNRGQLYSRKHLFCHFKKCNLVLTSPTKRNLRKTCFLIYNKSTPSLYLYIIIKLYC